MSTKNYRILQTVGTAIMGAALLVVGGIVIAMII
ncbi:hypothetical protein PHIN109289_10880 [Phaeobacter inhibens]|nr:hypothetical protein PhaeoP10_00182 [Phaeobacter inhibens]